MHWSNVDALVTNSMRAHPVYWARLWFSPSGENDGEFPAAWNAEVARLEGAIDVEQALAWAGLRSKWFELFVEVNADPSARELIAISGYNPTIAGQFAPAEFISDSARATELSELLRSLGY